METTYIMDKYLESMKGREVKVFITNGFQMTGILEAFDKKTIQLRKPYSNKKKLVFFNAISTIEE